MRGFFFDYDNYSFVNVNYSDNVFLVQVKPINLNDFFHTVSWVKCFVGDINEVSCKITQLDQSAFVLIQQQTKQSFNDLLDYFINSSIIKM